MWCQPSECDCLNRCNYDKYPYFMYGNSLENGYASFSKVRLEGEIFYILENQK